MFYYVKYFKNNFKLLFNTYFQKNIRHILHCKMTAQQAVLKTHVWYLLNTIKIIICCICYKSIFLKVLHFIRYFYNFHNIKIVLE